MKIFLKLIIIMNLFFLIGCNNDSNVTEHITTTKNIVTLSSPKKEVTFKKENDNIFINDSSIITIAKSKEDLSINITQEEIEKMIDEVLSYSGEFDELIKDGQNVVLKPNLVQMKVDSTGEFMDREVNGVTTDWRVTNAIVKRIRKLNPSGKIYVAEGSATGSTSEIMNYYNYTKEYMPDVDEFISLEEDCGAWQDFNSPEIVKVDFPEGLLHNEYYFNKIVYEADVLISIPCLKTSSGVVVTAGIKNVSLGTPPGNIYGVSEDNPGKTNMVSHKIVDGELDKWIYDYYMCRPIDYVIVDGLQGFQHGPVPMNKERTESDKMNMGIILAGKDVISVDSVCALITGWDNESVGYLNHFKEQGVGNSDISKIIIQGNFIDELRKNFTIKRLILAEYKLQIMMDQ